MNPETPPECLIPDPNFLPPVETWNAIPPEKLLDADERSRRPLNNGNFSPGIATFRERQKELLISNKSAFRTIRRIPAPTGEPAARLGNAYEFFKNLDFFSAYWPDTSLPSEFSDIDNETLTPLSDDAPTHLRTHVRTGTGSQLPPDFRQQLLTAFVKLVAYDFGCNVSFPRCEPRLHLTPSSTSLPPSYFNSSATFVYRSPVDRSSARSGIVEGPVAALSSRGTTGFATEAEEHLDLAREVIALLLTAQQRAREHKTEVRFGQDKWWTSTPRWGGGRGGPVGRECEGDEILQDIAAVQNKALDLAGEGKQKIGGIDGWPSSGKQARRLKDGQMAMYQPYRKMVPPSSSWDRRARYCAIGKMSGQIFDDVFLVSALNHHVCILRARIPDALLKALDGEDIEWGKLCLWRSKWYDLFLPADRVAAMSVIWGMMAWLMRKTDGYMEKEAEMNSS